MATMSKVLHLKDNEMDDLADFLGHYTRVHRQYYRLPEGTLQLAKISKVLLALEQELLHEFKGRNLDEISIDLQGSEAEDKTGDMENGLSYNDRKNIQGHQEANKLIFTIIIITKHTLENCMLTVHGENPYAAILTEKEVQTQNKLVACFLKRQSMHGIQASFYARNRLFSARKCCFEAKLVLNNFCTKLK
ncbi:hypothetical protein Q5P01_000663 [Channa striata]|uniref:Uncharacterized protein n=1 Tax=Channa striata TaxID=64152 RepID=A0AA88IRS0_CHASR|nr:hypothetical protein Q5P01_000663 [Channa striata]